MSINLLGNSKVCPHLSISSASTNAWKSDKSNYCKVCTFLRMSLLVIGNIISWKWREGRLEKLLHSLLSEFLAPLAKSLENFWLFEWKSSKSSAYLTLLKQRFQGILTKSNTWGQACFDCKSSVLTEVNLLIGLSYNRPTKKRSKPRACWQSFSIPLLLLGEVKSVKDCQMKASEQYFPPVHYCHTKKIILATISVEDFVWPLARERSRM